MRAAKAAAARRATRVRRLLARAPASASGGRAACARWPRRTPARTLPLMYGPADADLLRLGLAVGDEAGHRRHAHVGSARRLAATTDGRTRRQGLLLGQERRICKDLVHLVAHSLVRHRGVTLAVAAPEWRRRARAHAHRLGLPVGGRPPVQHGRKSRSARERADSTRLEQLLVARVRLIVFRLDGGEPRSHKETRQLFSLGLHPSSHQGACSLAASHPGQRVHERSLLGPAAHSSVPWAASIPARPSAVANASTPPPRPRDIPAAKPSTAARPRLEHSARRCSAAALRHATHCSPPASLAQPVWHVRRLPHSTSAHVARQGKVCDSHVGHLG